MNIYYQKVIGLNVRRMFREIFRGTLVCGMIAVIICAPVKIFFDNNWVTFLMKCMFFCMIYLLLLWKFGMNIEERKYIENYRKG